MGCQRMTMIERMDIFRLLYVEGLKPSAIATELNREPSSVDGELEKGVDKGCTIQSLSKPGVWKPEGAGARV
ncbi:MAG: helix-turn-helix domain-containing protein, partial [Treponema sp.]|nr:helix-turn-helix domain-containing protein [Treponema sp.]